MTETTINIRPHLIPYFMKEFEGKDAGIMNRKISSIRVSKSSSLGQWMALFMLQVGDAETVSDQYVIYLVCDEGADGKKYYGNYYREDNGRSSFIEMPQDVHKAINGILEDIFRMAFVSWLDGYLTDPAKAITTGIEMFIDKYELLEVGFSVETMRQLYYREKNKGKLERFRQSRGNNRSGHFQ